MQLRRKYAGFLLNSIRCIKSITLKTQDDLGNGCHTQTTEPYFYEAAYLHVRETLIPVNDDGECVVAKGLHDPTSARCPQGVSQTLYLVGNRGGWNPSRERSRAVDCLWEFCMETFSPSTR